MTDKERLDWLNADNSQLENVRGLMNNEEEFADIRDAIDEMARRQGWQNGAYRNTQKVANG